MTYLLLTLLIGGCIGYVFYKINVPGGFMIGAFVGVAVLSIFFNAAYMPGPAKTLAQIVAGAFIGASMEKSDVKRLPHIIKPTIIMIFALLVLNIIAGMIIYWISPLDLVTSLMCVVPGRIADTPIIAVDMGADAPKVAIMQMVRQILGIAIFPSMILLYDNKRKAAAAKSLAYASTAEGAQFTVAAETENSGEASTGKRVKSTTSSWQSFLCTMAVAIIFGLLGKRAGIPGSH